MDLSAKKLAKLLTAPTPNVRAATLVVAGELGVKDADLAAAALTCLGDPAGFVRTEAIRTAGKLKLDKALPTLLERIAHGGPEGEAAARSAAQLGAKGVAALQELMHKVVPGVRKYIAAALAETGADGGGDAAVAVFREPDAVLTEAAAHSLAARIPEMSEAKRKDLASKLVALATGKKPPLPKTSEPSVLRLLSALNVPTTAGFFWERTQAPYPPDTRQVAIQTVGAWTESLGKEQLKKLIACAKDPEFRVVGPALSILEKLPYTAKLKDEWIGLFAAPDVAARRLAVAKIGGEDDPVVADGLMAQRDHHDKNLKDAARAALVKTESGRAALTDALLAASNVEEAWALARGLAPAATEFPTKRKSVLLAKAAAHLETGSHLADPFLFLLKESDPTYLRDGLFDRAVELRKKKKYEGALAYLKFLGRDPAAGFPLRFELACVGVKLSRKELGRDSRTNDSCLSQFAHAANADFNETVKQLDKAKWIDADDLFYVGFHFAEDLGRLRQFGAACLKMCVARSPKGKVAQNAKTKLKTIAT